MQADVQRTALKNFETTRDEFVEELEGFSGGDAGGRGVVGVEVFLSRLLNTLSMWTLVRKDTDKQGKCFEKRCEILMVLTDEISASTNFFKVSVAPTISEPVLMKMFDMLAMQVGSLTLRGCSDEDYEAVQNARMVEQEQYRWEHKPQEDDDDRRDILRNLWSRFYYKDQDCDCQLCTFSYLPTCSPTPSPPLSPMFLDDSESDWTSSSSEEE
ncbi:hypothetical protein PITC_025040 [Penicillium italicum]|uniref:Uncharacterized protein n=1 Tax=Penicillium italicum TaxID=40296 RepID=A0A0A2LFK9_PENIT|nr:hypothetical protein PITC_025040 [Penicillium italicum]